MTSDGPIIAVFDDWGSVSKAFTKAGATVLQVDTNKQAKRALEVADAIALTGGGDVAPERYGALNRHKRVYGVSSERDQREFKAVKKALAKGLPMFGICRGLQLLNVAHGGSLTQHIYDNDHVGAHEGVEHAVKIRTRSQVGKALGKAGLMGTSIHHQAIARMGHGLLPAGWAMDGTVEMIESVPGPKPYVLATQFHPELDYITDDTAFAIFEHFVDMAKRTMLPHSAQRVKTVKYMVYKPFVYTSSTWTKSSATPGSSSLAKGYGHLDDGDWRWDGEARMWVAADYLGKGSGRYIPMSADELDRWNDDDYTEWDALNTLARTVNGNTDEEDSHCAFPPCKNPEGCAQWGDCESEAVANQSLGAHMKAIELAKRGHKRGASK